MPEWYPHVAHETSLYDALKVSAQALVEYKRERQSNSAIDAEDENKKEKTLALRIICLSDGKDVGSVECCILMFWSLFCRTLGLETGLGVKGAQRRRKSPFASGFRYPILGPSVRKYD